MDFGPDDIAAAPDNVLLQILKGKGWRQRLP